MKLLSTLCIVFLSLTAVAQREVVKEVESFDTLKVYDLMEVNLIPSNENRVVIKGNKTHEVRVISEKGKLKLRMETDTRFRGEDTYIEVYYKSISVLDANEGARIISNEMMVQDEIELRAQEGGYIRVGLDVKTIKAKAVTGGVIAATGTSVNQEIKINTGGIFEGRSLQTKNTKIAITAAGEAEINATELADVRITAGGDVDIWGNPKEIDEKRFAGGRVRIMN